MMNWLLKYTQSACHHTHKIEFMTKTTSKTFHEQCSPWGCPCSKTQVRRCPRQCPPDRQKHDKVRLVWLRMAWENMMKRPWGVVSAEKQGAETRTLQCPTCWSKGEQHFSLKQQWLKDNSSLTNWLYSWLCYTVIPATCHQYWWIFTIKVLYHYQTSLLLYLNFLHYGPQIWWYLCFRYVNPDQVRYQIVVVLVMEIHFGIYR